MFARTSLCLALGLLVGALLCGNPWLPSAGHAPSSPVPGVRSPVVPDDTGPDEVCPDLELRPLVVGFHRDEHGNARWSTRDGRQWRRDPERPDRLLPVGAAVGTAGGVAGTGETGSSESEAAGAAASALR